MIKFLHISDLHIHRSGNSAVAKVLTFIRKNYQDHRLIVTGDVTDNGSAKEYLEAKRLLAMFPYYYACPGNHDYGFKGNYYSKSAARRFDSFFGTSYYGWNRPKIDYIEQDGTKVVLIGLDSNLETKHPFDFAQGKIGLWQRFWLGQALRKYANAAKIVYFHHHLFWTNPLLTLKDKQKVMRLLYGQAEVVCFGHQHHSEIWEAAEKPWFILSAGKLAEQATAREITIEEGSVKIKNIALK